MTATWSRSELQCLREARELDIAVRRADGTLRRWTPVWVVCAENQPSAELPSAAHVYVRTWHRRDTGWYGQALRSGRARIRVPGLEADVMVEDVGAGPAGVAVSVDAAYWAKYGQGGTADMVTADAVASTLRLSPERPVPETAPEPGAGTGA